MIQHTVAFRLEAGTDTDAFWTRATRLSEIDGERFEVLRQIGRKNDFEYALSMWFESQAEYDAYNAHPDHVTFVEQVWLPDVADFIELDDVVAN